MQIGNPSSASIAASVWAFTGLRALTNNTGTFTDFSGNTAVGAGLILDLRPAANNHRSLWTFQVTATTITTPGTYDGTTFTTSGTGSNPSQYTMFGGAAIGPAWKNSGAVSQNYAFAGFDRS